MKYDQRMTDASHAKKDEAVPKKRSYQKALRAEMEKETGEAILRAALTAFAREPFDRVTLRSIAENSGVTVQTVIRRFGSKEKLFETLVKQERTRILAARKVSEDAGLSEALEALVSHYEQDGDMILNFVAQEHFVEPVGAIVEQGRRVHRKWVEKHCYDLFEGKQNARRQRLLYAAIVATDLSTWKLLRRDLGLEPPEVISIMNELLNSLKGGS